MHRSSYRQFLSLVPSSLHAHSKCSPAHGLFLPREGDGDRDRRQVETEKRADIGQEGKRQGDTDRGKDKHRVSEERESETCRDRRAYTSDTDVDTDEGYTDGDRYGVRFTDRESLKLREHEWAKFDHSRRAVRKLHKLYARSK